LLNIVVDGDAIAMWHQHRIRGCWCNVGGMGGIVSERAVEGIMILLPRAVRVYFAIQPVNLRRSFDGLSNEVRSVLRHDPLTGHVFVFLNRRKTQVKLLLWTRGGYTIIHKRLERGAFSFPARVTSEATSVVIDAHELAMLLEGIDAQRVHTSKRWEPPAHARVDVVTMRDPM
jgi:transposase